MVPVLCLLLAAAIHQAPPAAPATPPPAPLRLPPRPRRRHRRRADRRRHPGRARRSPRRRRRARLRREGRAGHAARGHQRPDLPRRQPEGDRPQRRLLPQGPRAVHGPRPGAGRRGREDGGPRGRPAQGDRGRDAEDGQGAALAVRRLGHRLRRGDRQDRGRLHAVGGLHAVRHAGIDRPVGDAGPRRAVADVPGQRHRAHHDQPAASAEALRRSGGERHERTPEVREATGPDGPRRPARSGDGRVHLPQVGRGPAVQTRRLAGGATRATPTPSTPTASPAPTVTSPMPPT